MKLQEQMQWTAACFSPSCLWKSNSRRAAAQKPLGPPGPQQRARRGALRRPPRPSQPGSGSRRRLISGTLITHKLGVSIPPSLRGRKAFFAGCGTWSALPSRQEQEGGRWDLGSPGGSGVPPHRTPLRRAQPSRPQRRLPARPGTVKLLHAKSSQSPGKLWFPFHRVEAGKQNN